MKIPPLKEIPLDTSIDDRLEYLIRNNAVVKLIWCGGKKHGIPEETILKYLVVMFAQFHADIISGTVIENLIKVPDPNQN